MRRNKGKPSGINKSQGTGVPADFKAEDLKSDKRISGKYTENDKNQSERVKTRHPNRNVDKRDSTNAGGYRN